EQQDQQAGDPAETGVAARAIRAVGGRRRWSIHRGPRRRTIVAIAKGISRGRSRRRLPRALLRSLCPSGRPFEHCEWHLLSRKESVRACYAKHRLAAVIRIRTVADEFFSL